MAYMADVNIIIQEAGAKGISLPQIREKARKASVSEEALQSEIKRLRAAQQIAGPVKYRGSLYYYSKGYEPGGESVSRMIEAAVRDGGERLMTLKQLEEKKIHQPFKRAFDDGVAVLVGSGRAVKVKGGSSTYLLHVDVARRLLPALEAPVMASSEAALTGVNKMGTAVESTFRSNVWTAYEALKLEQHGLSAVSIGRLIRRLSCTKEALHKFLLAEAAAERADLHPTTLVETSEEDREGALPLPGRSEPAVTVTLRRE